MAFRDKEGGLGLKIDLDQLVWLHLQKVAASFDAPEFASSEQHTQFGGTKVSSGRVTLERFENAVLAVYDLILPEWVEDDNKRWERREALYWGQKALYENKMAAYRVAVAEWESPLDPTLARDPMKHPSRPLPPIEAKPFQEMIDEAYSNGTWQPFKLHKAIIQLLHRKGFFRDKTQLAVIEGTLEQAEAGTSSSDQTGSQDTAVEDGTLSRSILES